MLNSYSMEGGYVISHSHFVADKAYGWLPLGKSCTIRESNQTSAVVL